MPSITQWSALGGLGKAAGQSLQEILAHRLAQEELARREAADEQQRREYEALTQHRRDTLAQDQTQFEATQTRGASEFDRSLTSLQGVRDIAARDADIEIQDTATKQRRAAEAQAIVKGPEFYAMTPAERYAVFAEAYPGVTPAAGALESPAERKARLIEAEDIQTKGRIREIQATPRGGDDTDKPTQSDRDLPPELDEVINSMIEAAGPGNLGGAREFVQLNREKIRQQYPTAKLSAIDAKLRDYYGGAIVARQQRAENLNDPVRKAGKYLEGLYSTPPVKPTWSWPGEAPGSEVVVKDPGPGRGVAPPTVRDPGYEAMLKRLRDAGVVP